MCLTCPIDTIVHFQVLPFPRENTLAFVDTKFMKFINFLIVHMRANFDGIVKVWRSFLSLLNVFTTCVSFVLIQVAGVLTAMLSCGVVANIQIIAGSKFVTQVYGWLQRFVLFAS